MAAARVKQEKIEKKDAMSPADAEAFVIEKLKAAGAKGITNHDLKDVDVSIQADIVSNLLSQSRIKLYEEANGFRYEWIPEEKRRKYVLSVVGNRAWVMFILSPHSVREQA
jgi:hypothetical protein